MTEKQIRGPLIPPSFLPRHRPAGLGKPRPAARYTDKAFKGIRGKKKR